jgi:hypothetical protein
VIQKIALGAIVLALAVAEIVRPTTFAPKRVSHTSMLGIVARPTLDQAELDDLPPTVTPAIGNIDSTFAIVAGRARPLMSGETVPRGATVRLVGWCGDASVGEPGSVLLAVVDAKRRIDVSSGYRLRRDDVATTLHAPALRDTGFSVDLSANDLGPGVHDVRIALVTADERAVSEFPTVVSFSVANPP